VIYHCVVVTVKVRVKWENSWNQSQHYYWQLFLSTSLTLFSIVVMLDVFLACLILTRTSLYIFGQLYLHMRRRQSKRMNERTAAGSAAASGAGSQYGRCRTYVRSELRCRRRSDRTEDGGGVAPIHRVVVKTDTHWRTDDTFQAETFVLHHERRLRRPSPSPVVPQPVISRGLSIGSGRAGGGWGRWMHGAGRLDRGDAPPGD